MLSQFHINRVNTHLGNGGGVALLLTTGGVLEVASPIKVDSGAIIATDRDGDTSNIGLQFVLGYSFLKEPVQDAAAEAVSEAWQAAFLRLRAACDESEDPAVRAAVADLEAIEEGQANAGE